MSEVDKPIDKLIHDLKERAKELNCLYQVQELLSTPGIPIDVICEGIIRVIPPGWQYPDVCQARITLGGRTYSAPGLRESPWVQSADIVVQEETLGRISVYYTEECPPSDEGPFLKEERKLINTIAEQFGFFLLHQQLRQVFQERMKSDEERKSEWGVILDLLKRTDPGLLMRIARKMINYLDWSGVEEAEHLLEVFGPVYHEGGQDFDANRPFQQASKDLLAISDEVFLIASRHLAQDVILENIQKWVKEDRSGFLVNALVSSNSSLTEVSAAIERYHLLARQGIELTPPREKWFRVALIRRILSDDPKFIKVAKEYLTIDDFTDFMRRVIFPVGSHGKLGGKGAGLFLADQILKRAPGDQELLRAIKTPKTWYLTSDTVFFFMSYNNLEDVMEQKYKELGQVRQEYPYVVHDFKNSPLPPEIVKGLSLALDDFGEVPLIVRSSSLLEDQTGSVFAGKYKSLFIANMGSKEERLIALIDAVAEVFASMFAPDPIEYRYEHSLIDHHEEMGILIQEVVGKQVGHYYLPAFAGVAFSDNEYSWSSRIKREDGLIRLVPGLGTRAVDRLSDDYPVLIAPGQPRLRVNVTLDEIVRYSPKKVDVINLKTRTFEAVELSALLRTSKDDYPILNQVVSILREDRIEQPAALGVDYEKESFVVTFDGLFTRTSFLKQMQTILKVLQNALDHPVDVEFAHDGENFYLLQCRSQSYGGNVLPASIPHDIDPAQVIFTANRYVTNGIVQDLTHVVYVDPLKYSELTSYQDLTAVGRAIGRLNQILPKRQFILIGPGRWGSRGDIRLGVGVGYSDLNNTAMLVEVARKQNEYIPDPSFGTHFFQDLVEASIRYLPLYPDDPSVVFNEAFLTETENILGVLLPDCSNLSEVLRVIDVQRVSGGKVLQVLMNAQTEEALAVLTEPSAALTVEPMDVQAEFATNKADFHWRWRLHAAECIAAQLDPERFGVKAIYVFGSTKNATAGPGSDIDLLIHFGGTETQRSLLLAWLDGWSLSLEQLNYSQTGYKIHKILDVHLVTDEDIQHRSSYAVKIGAITDPARPLPLGAARC